MELLFRSLARVAVALVVFLAWCGLPMAVAQARGLTGVNETWGMLGMISVPIPLIVALGLGRSWPTLARFAAALAVCAAPSLYYGFAR